MSQAPPRGPVASSQLTPAQVQQLLDAVAIPIQPVPRTRMYQQRLFGAAVVMLVMSAVYLVLVGGLTVYLLRSLLAVVTFQYRGFLGLLFAGVPTFAGLCVLAALVKPLFARAERGLEPIDLQPEHEPLLFDFVSRLCQSVGAPTPARISVDTEVNASAGHIGGLLGKRLRLTIGLPLVLGFNSRQLAGVLAHEFGHFRQSTGMRTTYVIRRINQWFVHAAFERDAWDAQLVAWTEQGDIRWSWIGWIARGAVFVARLVLMGMIIVGNFFCARLLREMEYEADRVETRLAGSQAFATTCRQLRLLGLSQAAAMDELDRYRRESRLPDNLPALFVSNVSRVKPEKFREMEAQLLEVKTEWYDSHPSDRDRIENAAREQSEGTFRIEWPAACLFTDVAGLSRVVTLKLYQHIFGADFKTDSIKNTQQLIATKSVEVAQGEAALRFVLEQFCGYHTFHLPRFALGEAIDAKQYKQNAQVRRDQLLRMVRGYALIRKQEDQLMEDLAKVACSQRLIEAGLNVSQATELYPAKNLHDAHFRAQQLAQDEQRLKGELRPFRQMLGYRVMDALEFVRAEKIATQIGENPAVAKEVARILKALENVIRNRATYESLHFENRVIVIQLSAASKFSDEKISKSVLATADRIHHTFTQVHSTASGLMYPFAHGKGEVSLAYFLLSHLPPRGDLAAICSAAGDLEMNLELFLKRSIARLGSLAEKVEKAFGFPPLETPAEVRED